ncbi:MAG: hypothetical protein B0W54_23525 [Cellvibrio sp. 79]|nr:MAG: hypothetical protein B0W54_23525 [Cellvibrio sp. 79]
MNNIYLIESDGFDFKWIALEIDDFIDQIPKRYSDKEIFQYSHHNLKLSEGWKDISSEFIQTETKQEHRIPDVSLWLTGASLVLSPKAFSALEALLSPFGEFLPVLCNNENFYIFNCLSLAEADPAQSEHILQDGHIVGELKIGFDQKEVSSKSIFKTKFNACRDIYCGDTVKNIIESNNLTGVKFSPKLISSFD